MAQEDATAQVAHFEWDTVSKFFNVSWNQQRFYNVFHNAQLTEEELDSLIVHARDSYVEACSYGRDLLVSNGDLGFWDVDPTTVKNAYQYMLTAALYEQNQKSGNSLSCENIRKKISKELKQLRGKSKELLKSQEQATPEMQEPGKSEKRQRKEEDETFSSPKKTCKASAPVAPATVQTSNAFQILENEDTMIIDDPAVKIVKPPPIVFEAEGNMQDLLFQISTINGEEIAVKCHGKQISFRAKDTIQHEEIQKFLLAKKLQFHSYTPRSQRPTKLIVKGLPVGLEPAEVQEMFSKCGLQSSKVTRLYKPADDKRPPPFVATPTSKEEADKFLRFKRILNFLVKIEKLRRRRRGQLVCYRCQ